MTKVINSSLFPNFKFTGKAWAAISNGNVVAIKSMSHFSIDESKLESWVVAVKEEAGNYITSLNFSLTAYSSWDLNKIKKAAIAAGHPETGPRGGKLKPSAMLNKAREILLQADKDQFAVYRENSIKDLSEKGAVFSGEVDFYLGDYNFQYAKPVSSESLRSIEGLSADEVAEFLRELALRDVNGGDTFWQESAAIMIKNHALINEVLDRPWTLKSIRELIVMPKDELLKLLRKQKDKDISEIHAQAIGYRINDLVHMGEKTPKMLLAMTDIALELIDQV